MKKKCIRCGKSFLPTRPRQVYCSGNCRTAACRKRNESKTLATIHKVKNIVDENGNKTLVDKNLFNKLLEEMEKPKAIPPLKFEYIEKDKKGNLKSKLSNTPIEAEITIAIPSPESYDSPKRTIPINDEPPKWKEPRASNASTEASVPWDSFENTQKREKVKSELPIMPTRLSRTQQMRWIRENKSKK